MRIWDRASTLDGRGVSVEVAFEPVDREPFWWPSGGWWLRLWRQLYLPRQELRIRILDEQGGPLVDVLEDRLYLICLYSGNHGGRTEDRGVRPGGGDGA